MSKGYGSVLTEEKNVPFFKGMFYYHNSLSDNLSMLLQKWYFVLNSAGYNYHNLKYHNIAV